MPLALLLLPWFFASGMTGLVYEIVWTRMFTTLFGASLPAVSSVTACFLFGLGAGARWFGRRAGAMRRPLATYGLLEIAIGAYALASPALMAILEGALTPILGASATVLAFVRLAAAMLFLIPPTFCMGGTLPILVRFWCARESELPRRLSLLYAANTLGAAVGALAAGNVLLSTLGVWPALGVAAALNAAVGVAALLAQRAPQETIPEVRRARPEESGAWKLPLAAGVLGAVSLLHQVAWARALSPFFGSSVYAVSAVLGSFLTGIAAGSLLLPRLLRGAREGRSLLSSLQLRLAFYTLLFTAVVPGLPALYVGLYRLLGESFWAFLGGQYLLILAITGVPTAIIGASFPLLCLLACPDDEDACGATGRIYFWNSGGNLVGALAAGFLLIPAIGIQHTIALGVAGSAAVGLSFADWRLPTGARRALYSAGVLLLFWWLVPPWSRESLSAGPYAVVALLGLPEPESADPAPRPAAPKRDAGPGRAAPAPKAAAAPHRESVKTARDTADSLAARGFTTRFRVLYYREGAHASVAVTEDQGGVRTLTLDGKADASTGPGDMAAQLLLGHLPLLAHGQARSALVVGLGSGVTLGAVARHPLQRIDCVEIESAMRGAALLFRDVNGNALDDPRVRLHFEDARTFLRATPERYDVIISEPSNLWMGGVSHLFTREHFMRCREALAPGGVLCQWLHLYQIGPDDFRMAVRTLLDVFPRGAVFLANSADVILLATTADGPALEPAWPSSPEVQADLLRAGVSGPQDQRLRARAGGEALAEALRGVPVNTDGHPRLEFSTARHQFVDRSAEIVRWLTRGTTDP